MKKHFYTFILCATLFSSVISLQAASLTTGNIAGVLCTGTTVNVPFTAKGFSAGNIFTVQLSNASGSFASPVVIGKMKGKVSDSITATIPLKQASGTKYRIRVVGSKPATTGSNNGSDLTIDLLTAVASCDSPLCAGSALNLFVTSSSAASYSWIGPNNFKSSSPTPTIPSAVVADSGNYFVTVQDSLGCVVTTGTYVLVDSLTPSVIIDETTTKPFCVGNKAAFVASPTNGGTTPEYRWMLNGAQVGTNSANYTDTLLATGIYALTCTMISNAACIFPDSANSDEIEFYVLQKPVATPIEGPTSGICPITNNSFKVAPAFGFATYKWSITETMSIESGQSTDSVSVHFSRDFTKGALTEQTSNICGVSGVTSVVIHASKSCRTDEQEEQSEAITAYPNPAHDELNVQFTATGSNAVYMIRMMDITGRVVMTKNSNALEGNNLLQVDLNAFAKGIYFLSVNGEEQNKQIRIVVQ